MKKRFLNPKFRILYKINKEKLSIEERRLEFNAKPIRDDKFYYFVYIPSLNIVNHAYCQSMTSEISCIIKEILTMERHKEIENRIMNKIFESYYISIPNTYVPLHQYTHIMERFYDVKKHRLEIIRYIRSKHKNVKILHPVKINFNMIENVGCVSCEVKDNSQESIINTLMSKYKLNENVKNTLNEESQSSDISHRRQSKGVSGYKRVVCNYS